MTYNTEITKYPLNLMPSDYLAICYIQTLKDDRNLTVLGVDEAIADIRSNHKEFVLGTVDDVEERYNESVRTLLGQVKNGNLIVKCADAESMIENSCGKKATKGTPLIEVVLILSQWKKQLLLWSGKNKNPVYQ